jgi:hypothetical protein
LERLPELAKDIICCCLLQVIPSIVCVLLGQPPHILQPAADIATYVHGFVRLLIAVALPMPYKWPWQAGDSSSDSGPPDVPAKDLLVLVAVTFTTVSDKSDRSGSGSCAHAAQPSAACGLAGLHVASLCASDDMFLWPLAYQSLHLIFYATL